MTDADLDALLERLDHIEADSAAPDYLREISRNAAAAVRELREERDADESVTILHLAGENDRLRAKLVEAEKDRDGD